MAEAWEDPGRSDEDHTDPNDHTRGRILTALPARSDAGFRRGDDGELVPHEAEQKAIREMAGLRAQGKSLTAIADAMRRGKATRSVMRAPRWGHRRPPPAVFQLVEDWPLICEGPRSRRFSQSRTANYTENTETAFRPPYLSILRKV
jgi:hypothetical protein